MSVPSNENVRVLASAGLTGISIVPSIAHKAVCYVILVALLSCIIGCASRRFQPVLPIYEPDRNAIARERAQGYFIKAREYDFQGMPQMAEQAYAMAYELDPGSEVLRDILVQRYVMGRNYSRALSLIRGDRKTGDLSDSEKRTCAGLYVEMQQYLKAVEMLEAVSELTAVERGTLAYLYEQLKNVRKAVENYEKVFAAKPDAFEVGMKLADLYVRQHEYKKAESLYVALEEKHGDKAAIFNNLGRLKLIQKDTAAAITLFKTALLIDSTGTEALQSLAQIHIAKGEYDDAIHYYQTMGPDDFLGSIYQRRTLALLYYYNHQYDSAESVLQRLLAVQVDDYELHFYLGLVYAAHERFELAEIEFGKSLALHDSNVDAWQQLCYLCLRQKQWDKALDYAGRFRQRLPESGEAWRMYGYVLTAKKRYKEAIEALRKALTFDGGNHGTWFELGSALERSGKFSEAVKAFKRALKLNPQDDESANYLGYMWADRNMKLDSAKILIESALSREPNNGAYLDSYAWVFYRLGDLEKAEKYIRDAMQSVNDDPILFEHLGDILSGKKDEAGALEAYRKCLELDPENRKKIEEKIRNLPILPPGSPNAPAPDSSH